MSSGSWWTNRPQYGIELITPLVCGKCGNYSATEPCQRCAKELELGKKILSLVKKYVN